MQGDLEELLALYRELSDEEKPEFLEAARELLRLQFSKDINTTPE